MPDPTPPPELTLVGAGRLGRTLARLWAERGVFSIGDVVTRSAESARAAVDFIGAGRPGTLDSRPGNVGLVLVAVPDDRLADAAGWLAERAAFIPGAIAFHCSGAHPAAVLDPLDAAGLRLASAHPMHSFADPAASLASFAGTFCALEGDAEALDLLEPAISEIGGRPLRIRGEAKLLYHAGGVFASNHVTTLIDTALRLLDAAGIDASTGRELLAPLLHGAVDSALTLDPATALTGPVARGDAELVERQARYVAGHDAALGALYRQLAAATVELAARGGHLDAARVEALRAALDNAAQPSSMRRPTAQSSPAKP